VVGAEPVGAGPAGVGPGDGDWHPQSGWAQAGIDSCVPVSAGVPPAGSAPDTAQAP
jgi:hypothetical protein